MRDKVALLIIDVQKGLFERSTPIYRADELLDKIHTLVDRAHRAGIPVFYVQHANKTTLVKGSDAWQLHPGLRPTERDVVIHKRHGNAFEETILEDDLKSRDIRSLVVTGLVTHGCVRATCIAAKELGYRVILVRDGHSNFNRRAARLIAEWNRKLGEGVAELKSADEIDFGASNVISR